MKAHHPRSLTMLPVLLLILLPILITLIHGIYHQYRR